jgi:hypothetical protein
MTSRTLFGMKHSVFTLLLALSFSIVQAQTTVNIKGKINNFTPNESIYLGLDGYSLPLEVSETGEFSFDQEVYQTPSYYFLWKIAKRGKMDYITPILWFENAEEQIILNWADKTFERKNTLNFQAISEKMESLGGKNRLDFALDNPNSFASLHFVSNHFKFNNGKPNQTEIRKLEKYIAQTDEHFKESNYFKKIESFLAAKNNIAPKKAEAVKDFNLINKQGINASVMNQTNKNQVIALLSSDCYYSLSSLNFLAELSVKQQGTTAITTIWVDNDEGTWLNSEKERKEKIVGNNHWDQFGYARAYLNVDTYPTFLFVNQEGKLTKRITGFNKKKAKKIANQVE